MTSFSWFSGKRDPSRKFKMSPSSVWVERMSCGALLGGLELLEEDRPPEAHGVHALERGELQDRGDLLPGRAGFERAPDVPAHAWCVHVRARRVERDADELDSSSH